MTTETPSRIREIRDMSVFWLSSKEFADCGSPDAIDSAGGKFLDSVRDATLELIDRVGLADLDPDTVDDDGSVQQIADDAPDVYTWTKWQEFTDLAAWQEDVEEYAGDESDMDKLASIALFIIAERLAWAIIRDVCEWRDEQEEADEEAGETVPATT